MRKLNCKEIDLLKGIFQNITTSLNNNREVFTLESDLDFRKDLKIVKKDGLYTIIERTTFKGLYEKEIFNSPNELDLIKKLKEVI